MGSQTARIDCWTWKNSMEGKREKARQGKARLGSARNKMLKNSGFQHCL